MESLGFCSKCGKPQEGQPFCRYCGNDLTSAWHGVTPPPKRRWRGSTWAIGIWTGLMAAWALIGCVGVIERYNDCENSSFIDTCEAATATGGTVGMGIVLFIWFLVVVPLGLYWMATKPKES